MVLQHALSATSRRLALAAGLLTSVTTATLAQAGIDQQSEDTGLTFLAPSDVDVGSLPPPPAVGTPAETHELLAMRGIQGSRTAADCARAASEVTISLDHFFGPQNGGPLSAAEVAKLDRLFAVLINEVKFFSNEGKGIWHQPRPYDVDKDLTPCVSKDPTWSYPSGHASVSRAFAQILSKIYPERWLAFNTRADQIAFDRVVGGVHHPADISAGQALGDSITAALFKNERFRSALSDAMKPK